jgi:ABC-type iron transport system FetAB permease component
MEMMNDIDSINTFLNDIWNFQLMLFGLSVTLFTVIFSFVIAKRDELRAISDLIKSGDQTIITKPKEIFAKNYILKLKKINDHITILIIVSLMTSLFGWFSERFISDCSIKLKFYILLFLITATSLTCIAILIQSRKIFKYYRESTNI